MYSRKQFLKKAVAAGAGLVAANSFMSCLSERKLENIGYISGILGPNLRERDWKTILGQTAEYGYSEIEIGNYLGESASSFLAFCKDIGLKPVAGSLGGMTEDTDVIHQSMDRLNALEMKYGVIYWPFFVGAPFSLDDCKRSVEVLNKTGEICKSRGITLLWHNHDHEFVAMEEGLPFDFLMENTDEDLVQCELDIYWVTKGGADPVEVLKRYSGRYRVLHVKDMAPGEELDFACPGDGIIEWEQVFAESVSQGIQHFNVERDNVVDGLGCLRSASQFLRGLRF